MSGIAIVGSAVRTISLEGTWQGRVEFRAFDGPVFLRFSAENSRLAGTMSIPRSLTAGLPLNDIAEDNDRLQVRFPGGDGRVYVFRGQRTGDAIFGEITFDEPPRIAGIRATWIAAILLAIGIVVLMWLTWTRSALPAPPRSEAVGMVAPAGRFNAPALEDHMAADLLMGAGNSGQRLRHAERSEASQHPAFHADSSLRSE